MIGIKLKINVKIIINKIGFEDFIKVLNGILETCTMKIKIKIQHANIKLDLIENTAEIKMISANNLALGSSLCINESAGKY